MFIINGKVWHIIHVPPFNRILQRTDGSYTVGVCDNNTKIIYLSSDLEGDFLNKVLCHEITHAVMFSYDVYLDFYEEELVADLIATYGKEIIEITEKIFNKERGDKPLFLFSKMNHFWLF